MNELNIKECAASFEYFADNCLIALQAGGYHDKFVLHPFQRRLIKQIEENDYVIGSKFRQGGFSNSCVAYGLWTALYKTNQRVHFFAKSDRQALYLSAIFDTFVEFLPDDIKPVFSKSNGHEKVFANGNVIRFSSTEPAIGSSLTLMFADEAAFFDNAETWWKANFPTMVGKCVVLSTQHKEDTWFNQVLERAKKGDNKFSVYTCDFKEMPGMAEREDELKKNIGYVGFCVEMLQIPPEKVAKVVLDELKVINAPDDRWLERLRQGHFVWLVKEKRFAKIEWAYEPPNPGCFSGRIALCPCWRHEDRWGTEHSQTWFIKPDARGFDGKLLLQPVADNCPDEAAPISDVWQRHIERELAQLLHRIEQLERPQLPFIYGFESPPWHEKFNDG